MRSRAAPRVEIPAKDLGHPVARRYQGWAQSHGLCFRGYILDDTAPEVCAGIGGANMDTPDLARFNGQRSSSLGIRNHLGGLSDLGSSPVQPTRHHEQSLHDSRRAQLSRSATDGFQTDETLLLEDLFGTKKKKMTDMTVQRSGDSLSRTTSMPASIPLPYNRGRRELGKQAPVITVSRASMLPRREDKAVSGSSGSGNPRDVLNAYSARREASRKIPVSAEPKPIDELDFSPLPGPLFNADRRNPSFTPDPARALDSSPTPAFDNEFDDLGSPPMLVDDIDVPVAVNVPEAPLFLPDDGSNRAFARPPSHSVNSRPPNGASVRPAPITVPIARANSAVSTHADENFAFQPKDAIIYEPGTYDIILVIDGREVKNKRDEDTLRKELSDKGITIEVKALNLGDMLWLARSRSPTLRGADKECVLDYVVERKRLDDLCTSIRDGRYDEQKVRDAE
ncbi:hypothetical protein QFC22_003429 [Naganishia vaughanmartiniae]|uniref:Uncharacterized protein n=1 Tax=Naganishia vaughanmartiniae TaxID=1424756 RepID=A0ACC2X8I2_9TREE|nr:hypothetical protein QFC22_003429 [Naganishia vaughanmartiniae]